MTAALYGGLAALNLGICVMNAATGEWWLAIVSGSIAVFLAIATVDAWRKR